MFDPNDSFLYIIVALVIAMVLAQSVYFLVKAWRRARALGMEQKLLRKTAVSSAIFTVAPAVAILLGVIALSRALGFPLPWLRLSVIGAITYETTAAATAAAAQGYGLAQPITDAAVFTAITWVMTLGIITSPILVVLLGKKIESGVVKLKSRDQKWGELFMTGLFLGMISAFLGVVFARVGEGLSGWIPVFVMLASAIIMAVCGLLRKRLGAWLEDYALPISMLGGMGLSIPITQLVNGVL